MNPHDERMDWRRLGDAVVARRVRLGWRSQKEFAEKSGLSLRLISDLERGGRESYDPSTFARIEAALEWAPGSVKSILDGGDPVSSAEANLSAMSVDPRAIERYGDDTGVMALVAGSGLPPADAMRLVLRIRRRRAEQYGELLADVRRWITEAGGNVPAEPQG